MSEKLKIGISVGDVNGIGPEIILKTLSDNRLLDYCTPVVYGNTRIMSFYRKSLEIGDYQFNVVGNAAASHVKRANMINCWDDDVKIEPGQANEEGGKYAFLSLERAVTDLVERQIDALVTAPIDKHTIQNDSFRFPGHTEYIQSRANADGSLMFLVGERLKVGVVTGHIPVSDVALSITKDGIISKLMMMHHSLKNDFWIQKPKIAVLALNPHAGDNGLIGAEEQEVILPAINEAKDHGIFAFGPYPADGFFANHTYLKFDAVLAMYHDQGLIPFKSIEFHNGVNFTAGLPVVRTSPDHGTGFDIAGKNLASESSFREAVFAAINIVERRKEMTELTANPLKIAKLSKDRD